MSGDNNIKIEFGYLKKENESIFSSLKEDIKKKLKIDERSDSESCENAKIIRIVFARMYDLHDAGTFKNVINEYRKTSKKGEDYNPCPMIVIGLEKLGDVLEAEIRDNEENKNINYYETQKRIVESLNLDKRIDFLDFSIWHYYIPLDQEFSSKLTDVIKKIEENFNNQLYKTNIAREFIEFHSRLFENSYLERIGTDHSSAVTPFRFHSETKMKIMADDYLEGKNGKPKLPDYKWRILLVDDYAVKNLKINGKEDGPTKKNILEKVLPYDWIEKETCNDIQSFIQLYSSKKNDSKIHDIILLDYLLGDVSVGKDERNGREYSTDILKWIKEDKDFLRITNNKLNKDLQGPLNKFWFFPISVFSFAFMEDIRQMSYTYYDDDWVIARGADPVNTPELFRYSLFKFMEAQVNEVTKISETFSPNNKHCNLLIAFLNDNFTDTNCVNQTAKNKYHIYLDLYANYNQLQNDKNKSIFIDYLIKSNLFSKINSDLFEHIQHLIYMLAYEPAYEWSKMWDEFIIVKQKVVEAFSDKSDKELIFLKNIENYIVNLQQQINRL